MATTRCTARVGRELRAARPTSAATQRPRCLPRPRQPRGRESVVHGAFRPRGRQSPLRPLQAPALAQHLRGAMGPFPRFWTFRRTSLISSASLRAGPAAHPVPPAAAGSAPDRQGRRAASRIQPRDAPRREPQKSHESHARRKWRQPRSRRAVPVTDTRSSKNATRGVSDAQAQLRPSTGAPPHCHV